MASRKEQKERARAGRLAREQERAAAQARVNKGPEANIPYPE